MNTLGSLGEIQSNRLLVVQTALLNASDMFKGEKPIRFIPIAGINSAAVSAIRFSSSEIAQRYSRLVNRDFPDEVVELLNLNCVALAYPQLEDNKTCRASVIPDQIAMLLESAFPDYKKVFGDPRKIQIDEYEGESRLIDEVDMILTGLSASNLKTFNKEKLSAGRLSFLYPNDKGEIPHPLYKDKMLTLKTLMAEVIEGEISGILLPRLDVENEEENIRIVDTLK